MKLYQEKSSVVYFGQIDNPYDKFLSDKYIFSYLKNKKGKILDLGCGAGRNSVALAKMGFNLVSIDSQTKPLEVASDYAKKSHVEKSIKFIKKDITKLRNNELGLFDYCILQEVIEHITDYQNAINFAYSSLRNGGVLILSTQYNPKLWNTLDDYAQHIKRFTKNEIEISVKKFSKKKIIISGFPFLRLVHFFYGNGLKLLHKEHNTPEFMKHRSLLYTYIKIFPYFLKIDSLFDFTGLGKEIVVYAEK
jgi:2-polyprenyl-3-methyl-5-hydroxy-6-metoxy-1,4-benzoquinol methylase